MIYPNGIYYEGKFTENKPDKEGTWHFQNGNTVNGAFTFSKEADPDGGEKPLIKLTWATSPQIEDVARKYALS